MPRLPTHREDGRMHIPSLAELEELGLVSPETVEEVKQMP